MAPRRSWLNTTRPRRSTAENCSSVRLQGPEKIRAFCFCSRSSRELVARVAPGGQALLNVEHERECAGGPVALGVLADNFLRDHKGSGLRFFCFFLVGFRLINLDQ